MVIGAGARTLAAKLDLLAYLLHFVVHVHERLQLTIAQPVVEIDIDRLRVLRGLFDLWLRRSYLL